MDILDYPSRAHRTGRGPGQKFEKHLLKLHTRGTSKEPRRKMNMGRGKPGGSTVLKPRVTSDVSAAKR